MSEEKKKNLENKINDYEHIAYRLQEIIGLTIIETSDIGFTKDEFIYRLRGYEELMNTIDNTINELNSELNKINDDKIKNIV